MNLADLFAEIVQEGFSARVAVPGDALPRRHTCISRQIYHYYPYDNYYPPADAEPPVCCGGNDLDATEIEEVEMAVAGPLPTPSPTPSPPPVACRVRIYSDLTTMDFLLRIVLGSAR